MEPTASRAFELPGTEFLFSLLISQIPILLGITLLAVAVRPGHPPFRAVLGRNLLVWLVATVVYGLIGFAIMYPGVAKPDLLLHWKSLFGDGASGLTFAIDVLMQACFCAASALLIAVALPATRGHWLALLFTLVFAAVLYPVFGSWHWGGGWLARKGFEDFAGGTTIYGTAGAASLVCAFLFREKASVTPDSTRLPALPWLLAIAFLWFLPSVLALADRATNGSDSWTYPPVQFALDSSTTAAGLGALFVSLALFRRVCIPSVVTAMFAGLATATSAADSLPVPPLALIACLSGILSVFASRALSRARLADPVAAIAGFGLGGTVGTLAIGFQESKTGIQLLGITSNALWTALAVALFLGFLFRPVRTSSKTD